MMFSGAKYVLNLKRNINGMAIIANVNAVAPELFIIDIIDNLSGQTKRNNCVYLFKPAI